MNLDTFLREEQMTETQFAERAGISQSAVNKYRNKKRVPRPATQVKIQRATSGAVTALDWLPAEAVAGLPK